MRETRRTFWQIIFSHSRTRFRGQRLQLKSAVKPGYLAAPRPGTLHISQKFPLTIINAGPSRGRRNDRHHIGLGEQHLVAGELEHHRAPPAVATFIHGILARKSYVLEPVPVKITDLDVFFLRQGIFFV